MSSGQFESDGSTSGRHRAPVLRPRRRLHGRRRWYVAAAAVAAFATMVAPPAAPTESAAAERTAAQLRSPEAVRPPASTKPLPTAGQAALVLVPAMDSAPVDAAQPAAPPAASALAANGIPAVALNAYRVAATRMNTARPGCGIDWSLLAGIGRIESNHGRYGGAVLGADGTSTPPVRGPALDGGAFARITDTDGGAYDGDTVHDRAVGPLQFIPSTWRSYAVDADGNGTTDPFDIDDAALAAAHYLCVAGGDLTTEAGLRRAVFAYNHSDAYVDQVLALARAYASGVPVDSLPPVVGDTSAPVPPPTGDPTAPASPGPPIGLDPAAAPPAPATASAPPPVAPAAPAPGSGATPTPTTSPAAPTTSAPAPATGSTTPPPTSSAPATPTTTAPQPSTAPPAPTTPPELPATTEPPTPEPPTPEPLPTSEPLPAVEPTPPAELELIAGVTCGLPLLPLCPE